MKASKQHSGEKRKPTCSLVDERKMQKAKTSPKPKPYVCTCNWVSILRYKDHPCTCVLWVTAKNDFGGVISAGIREFRKCTSMACHPGPCRASRPRNTKFTKERATARQEFVMALSARELTRHPKLLDRLFVTEDIAEMVLSYLGGSDQLKSAAIRWYKSLRTESLSPIAYSKIMLGTITASLESSKLTGRLAQTPSAFANRALELLESDGKSIVDVMEACLPVNMDGMHAHRKWDGSWNGAWDSGTGNSCSKLILRNHAALLDNEIEFWKSVSPKIRQMRLHWLESNDERLVKWNTTSKANPKAS